MLRHTMIIVAMLLTHAVFAQDFAGGQKIWGFDGENVTRARIHNQSGVTRVVAEASRTRLEVSIVKQQWDESCVATATVENQTLQVEVENSSWFAMATCQALIRVRIPANLDLEVASGFGPVQLSGTFASVAYESGAGSLTAEGSIGSFSGRGGSGDILVKGLAGGLDFTCGQGHVEVHFAKPVTDEDINIKTGFGNATIYVPRDTQVVSEYDAVSGDLLNEASTGSAARMRVSMEATTGSLTIRQASF